MEILRPDTWEEALALKAEHPDARPIAGGPDLMVELNFDRARPSRVLDLTRLAELTEHGPTDGGLRVGAGVTYTRLIAELGDRLPGLAIGSKVGFGRKRFTFPPTIRRVRPSRVAHCMQRFAISRVCSGILS